MHTKYVCRSENSAASHGRMGSIDKAVPRMIVSRVGFAHAETVLPVSPTEADGLVREGGSSTGSTAPFLALSVPDCHRWHVFSTLRREET